ncbi:MAG TPA: FAD:protein FMN transferase [Clostridiales bacterium]|nr:FAD:protein FMN transferase [Clostridiales bacterium]
MSSTERRCRLIAAALALFLFIPLWGCSTENEKQENQLFAMDTFMSLTAYGPKADEGIKVADEIINELDSRLDPEKEDSDLYRINANAGELTEVSSDIYNLLEVARQVNRRSGGALDPSIYKIVRAWGFIDQQYRVPDAGELEALLEDAGLDGVEVKSGGGLAPGRAEASVPDGAALTFGALAKGYAAQKAVEAMKGVGVKSAIISLGGDVQTLGIKPDGSLWSVAVQDPQNTGGYVGILDIAEAAVVTSGSYERYFTKDGVVYHHILDPKTGYPADSNLLSVTVVCESGAFSDALSTALFILGEEGALEYYREYGDCELILITDDNRVVVTPGLSKNFKEKGGAYSYEYLEF